MTNCDLIETVRRRAASYLDSSPRSETVLEAMERIDRACFVPHEYKAWAYIDEPVPIGFGQTCSQPSMVAFMLDKLELERGQKVLEIGTGCGYAAAIAVELIKPDGFYWGIEVIPELADSARRNLASLKDYVSILCCNGAEGLPAEAPFHRILVSAGVPHGFNPDTLLKQLLQGGILLYPEAHGSLYKLTKTAHGITRESWYGVAFVPLVSTAVR